jgi:hypothetical protein
MVGPHCNRLYTVRQSHTWAITGPYAAGQLYRLRSTDSRPSSCCCCFCPLPLLELADDCPPLLRSNARSASFIAGSNRGRSPHSSAVLAAHACHSTPNAAQPRP